MCMLQTHAVLKKYTIPVFDTCHLQCLERTRGLPFEKKKQRLERQVFCFPRCTARAVHSKGSAQQGRRSAYLNFDSLPDEHDVENVQTLLQIMDPFEHILGWFLSEHFLAVEFSVRFAHITMLPHDPPIPISSSPSHLFLQNTLIGEVPPTKNIFSS